VWYEVKSNNERWGKKLKVSKTAPQPGFQQFQPNPNKDKQIIRGMCFKVAGMAWANQYKHKQFELPHEVMVLPGMQRTLRICRRTYHMTSA